MFPARAPVLGCVATFAVPTNQYRRRLRQVLLPWPDVQQQTLLQTAFLSLILCWLSVCVWNRYCRGEKGGGNKNGIRVRKGKQRSRKETGPRELADGGGDGGRGFAEEEGWEEEVRGRVGEGGRGENRKYRKKGREGEG